MGENKNAHNIFDRKPEGKRPIDRPRHITEEIIKKYLRHTEYEDMD